MGRYNHWADVLRLRPEVLDNAGELTDLQMSLYDAVYKTKDLPYQDVRYYSDITEPTPALIEFMGRITRRLGTKTPGGKALYHLDDGMGGGKSHALVGLYHLAHDPGSFASTDLGARVLAEAERTGEDIRLSDARVVVLSADNMTPTKTSPEFGPATDLHTRFLWALFKGDRELYRRHAEAGVDKAALVRALQDAGGPVLILLDELMDYVMKLSDKKWHSTMPGEKAFLSDLMDAVDDEALPQVAFVIVMIRSDADERGYTPAAEDFRSYVSARVERNGETVPVTEAHDFAAIIRRRLFVPSDDASPIKQVADAFRKAAEGPWREQVFDRLGANRGIPGLADRLADSYPFHPDLMKVVREDWSLRQGFQRVRSTVEIFAAAIHYWATEKHAGRWAPDLIGIGDLSLPVTLEKLLSSGLLLGNPRAIQGFRAVASTDVISKRDERQQGVAASRGKAVEIDERLAAKELRLGQPAPAVRMATALFCYSLVGRAQGKRGATKAELLAAIFTGDGPEFTDAEEVFNALTDDDEGLGALDIKEGTGGGTPPRYLLATTQTLRMFFKQSRDAVQQEARDNYVWERAQAVADKGLFDDLILVTRPARTDEPLREVFSDIDHNDSNRLVVLDPNRWTLLNGRDGPTRRDIESMLGVGDDALPVDNAASCVVACVNTHRRDSVRKRAAEVLAWQGVVDLFDRDSQDWADASKKLSAAESKFEEDLRKAYQHFAFVVRDGDTLKVDWRSLNDDTKSSLRGSHVWNELVSIGRAVRPGGLSGNYLVTLLRQRARPLTLKELSQQFHKTPTFPLVSSKDDILTAVYETLAGPTSYEIATPEGEIADVRSPDDIVMYSSEQVLRPASAIDDSSRISAENDEIFTRGPTAKSGEGRQPSIDQRASATEYSRFVIELPNRSLSDAATRREITSLLNAITDTVDPALRRDVQLFDLKVMITATAEAVEAIKNAVTSAGARWRAEELDF